MPAKAGIQNYLKTLDSRLRGNDAKGRFKTFNEAIRFQQLKNFKFQITNKSQRPIRLADQTIGFWSY